MNFGLLSSLAGVFSSLFAAISEYKNKNWLSFLVKAVMFVGAALLFIHALHSEEDRKKPALHNA